MFPYMVKLNPIGLIIFCLFIFSIYLIYTTNSKTKTLMRSYQESNFIRQNNLENDILIPELSHNRHNLYNDEILKHELKLFEMVNLLELLNVIIQAAQNGGTQVRNIRKKLNIKWRNKGLKDPLTEADLFSHQVMVKQIFNSFPGIKIISEENGNKLKGVDTVNFENINKAIILDDLKNLPYNRQVALSKLTIWVDPLDATQEYTENLTDYVTTMVCVSYKGQPIIGVIHKPFQLDYEKNETISSNKATYWAWDNVGHSKNIEEMLNNRKNYSSLDKLNIIISRSHAGIVKVLSNQLFNNGSRIISAGGAGYKILELVKGNADVYLHDSLIKKWDICAPNAIINEISREKLASFTSLKGKPINYNYIEPKNTDGVLATINLNNSYFISKMKNILNL